MAADGETFTLSLRAIRVNSRKFGSYTGQKMALVYAIAWDLIMYVVDT
jgi:hypothetical protein